MSDEILELARQHHQAGRAAEAERLYRQILAQQPQHAEALNLLGALIAQTGRAEEAADLLRRAVAIDPERADFHFNLGVILMMLGQWEPSIDCYRQALLLKPDYPQAYNNLGSAMINLDRLDEAVDAFRQATILRPRYVQAHTNLGNALERQGKLEEAVAAHRQAVTLKADFAEGWYELGNALRGAARWDEAIDAYRRALALRPQYSEACNNLGAALTGKGSLDEAVEAYRQAIAMRPNNAQACYNLGTVLQVKGDLPQAIVALRQALELRPDYAAAYNNLGNVLREMGQLDAALACYDRAITLRPNHALGHSNRIHALHYHPDYDQAALAAEVAKWNQQHSQPLKSLIRPHPNTRDAHRRLRIGYVSANFRDHASAFYLAALLGHQDHDQFEITCYANVAKPDALTERFQAYADRWRSIAEISDQQAAEEIRADGIDILVDLDLHTLANRLLIFARQPAPVQASWLGYPGSTGMDTIQYRLSDRFLDPPGSQQRPGEQVIYLPDCFWCYDPLTSDVQTNDLPALQAGQVTFGCLSSFVKVNDRVLGLWARIMHSVSGSRLVLLCPPGPHRQAVVDKLDVEPDRVEFVQRQPRQQYLQTYHRIDLCLDTFPYNGHTTSLDGLWMGVPLVSLVGGTAVGRGGLSILSNLGHSELVAADAQQYVKIAVELAGDLGRLSELRRTLRPRMEQSPLMDAKRFAANMESAYRQMWRNWCRAL
ncbi:MAG: tetratricopeptide repeat protein [Tepidisphaeraceae bacterium]